ncbi:hypothetical protein J6590_059261 [Homalodisca vitripennis]|nr:hypothetical protein J6590_059261 [Homalodisca vitripennis]
MMLCHIAQPSVSGSPELQTSHSPAEFTIELMVSECTWTPDSGSVTALGHWEYPLNGSSMSLVTVVTQKLMCHLNLCNSIDAHDRLMTNLKCPDFTSRGDRQVYYHYITVEVGGAP